MKSFFREYISFSCVYEATSGYKNVSCFRVNIKENLKNERVFHDNKDIPVNTVRTLFFKLKDDEK